MAAFDPAQYVGRTFGPDESFERLREQYGINPNQITGLQQGGNLALGTSGYNLGRTAEGYQIQGGPQPSSQSSSSYSATSTPGPSAGNIGMTAMTPSTPSPGGATIQTQFRDALIGQLGTNPNAVSLTDPSLAPQARAYQNAQQRSQERAQQGLAEHALAAGALGTGAYGGELRNLEQARGESEAQYEAGLLGEEKDRRLKSLFEAMGLAGQQTTADEAIRLQRELGLGELDLRKLGITNDYSLGQGQLSLGLLQALLGDKQFNTGIGADLSKFGADLNFRSAFPFLK
jgi:hypothetical protein